MDLLPVDVDGGLFEQCLCGLFFVEGDKAEVLGLAIFASVHGSLDFHNVSVLRKVIFDLVFGDGLGELAYVNL